MFIQICLWGSLFTYPSDCSGLLLVTVKKAGCVARPSVSNAPLPGFASHLQWWVTWALGLFPGPLPALSFLFRTPTPVKYTQQFVWDKTLESYIHFLFLLQLSLWRLRVISHSALLCCAALTLTPGVLLGRAVMSLLLGVEWLSFLWMQFQTLISLTTVPEILLVICICWFQSWSISGIAFNFVIFLLHEFLLFLLEFFFFFTSYGFLCSFISTSPTPITFWLWKIPQNSWFIEVILPCFSGAWTTSVFTNLCFPFTIRRGHVTELWPVDSEQAW